MKEWMPAGATQSDIERLAAIEAGIPDYMRPHVVEWLCGVPKDLLGSWEPRGPREMSLRMKVDFPSDPNGFRLAVERLSEPELVAAVDCVFFYGIGAARRTRHSLSRILDDGRAGWEVTDDESGDPRLTHRIPEGVRIAFDSANATARAGKHLADAFECAYGAMPNPGHAYTESVLAVEALACPKVLPNNRRATLGNVITYLNGKPLSLPLREKDVPHGETVVRMMQLLWQGAHRHEGQEDYSDVTVGGARTAHALAVALVQMLHEDVILVGP